MKNLNFFITPGLQRFAQSALQHTGQKANQQMVDCFSQLSDRTALSSTHRGRLEAFANGIRLNGNVPALERFSTTAPLALAYLQAQIDRAPITAKAKRIIGPTEFLAALQETNPFIRGIAYSINPLEPVEVALLREAGIFTFVLPAPDTFIEPHTAISLISCAQQRLIEFAQKDSTLDAVARVIEVAVTMILATEQNPFSIPEQWKSRLNGSTDYRKLGQLEEIDSLTDLLTLISQISDCFEADPNQLTVTFEKTRMLREIVIAEVSYMLDDEGNWNQTALTEFHRQLLALPPLETYAAA